VKNVIQKATIGMIITVGIIGASMITLAGLTAYRTIPSTGNVKSAGVNVYWNLACTNETTNINWGTLTPNTTKSVTVYLRNNGTVPVTLSMATSGWNPSNAANYVALTWNCTGSTLNQNSVVAAHLTLAVSASTNGFTTFNFDITMTGTE